MPTANYLPDVLETTEAERLASGFIFTEGPLWHPEGYWHFVDLAAISYCVSHPAKSRSWSGPRSAATARPSTCKAV